MTYMSGVKYITSSSIIELNSNETSEFTKNPRRSASTRNSRFTGNNTGHTPLITLSIGSSIGASSCQEINLPRFALRSVKKTQIVRPNHQPANIEIQNDMSPPTIEVVEKKSIDIKNIVKILSYSLMLSLGLVTSMVGVDQTIRQPTSWNWSGQRNLKGRNCVLNFFIDKHSRNEYDPDYGIDISQHKGSYWTPGKFKVISRFISSVSGTFRHKINLKQHLIFAGVRDGGYLAQKAFESWPKRGSKFSEIHIISADVPNITDSLEYSYLDEIENRFHGTPNVHIYDRMGLAGVTEDVAEDDGIRALRNMNHHDSKRLPYPKLTSFIEKTDGDDSESELVIPYLHVDGLYMEDQLEILMSAVPLLKSKTIVSVGIEHSLDMNVLKLIKFFDSVEYKTFFLGSRQLARIDNLCPETLNDILAYPVIDPKTPTWSSMLLSKLGLRYEENLSTSGYKTPPFFVAFPRGRINREEMSIQHAYDLFGGIDGEKNVKTANDRINNK